MTGLWLDSHLALWALLGVVSLGLWAALRQIAELHAAFADAEVDQGLPVGEAAPALPETDRFGRRLPLPTPERPVLVVFRSCSCGACHAPMKALPEIALRSAVTLVALLGDGESEAGKFLQETGIAAPPERFAVLADPGRPLFSAYRISSTPYGILIDAEGRVAAKGLVNDATGVGRLVRQAKALPAPERAGAGSDLPSDRFRPGIGLRSTECRPSGHSRLCWRGAWRSFRR